MWRIEEHRRIDKQIASIPIEVLKRYEKWKDIALISGPPGLRLIKGFHDEAESTIAAYRHAPGNYLGNRK